MRRFHGTLLGVAAAAAAMIASSALAHEPGFMTGGGSIMCADSITGTTFRVTHGFALYCRDDDGVQPVPNNLEINWGGNHFHLTSLTDLPGGDANPAFCSDNPSLSPVPPTAPFDTFTGEGTGTYNGAPATIKFTLTDGGEPGTRDSMAVTIVWEGNTVLSCPLTPLTYGNQQAHRLTGRR